MQARSIKNGSRLQQGEGDLHCQRHLCANGQHNFFPSPVSVACYYFDSFHFIFSNIRSCLNFMQQLFYLSIILIKANCIMATLESALYLKSLAKRLKFC
jgi:hypothetical protein